MCSVVKNHACSYHSFFATSSYNNTCARSEGLCRDHGIGEYHAKYKGLRIVHGGEFRAKETYTTSATERFSHK